MKNITVADNFFVSTKNELKRGKRSIQEKKRVFLKPYKKINDFSMKKCKKLLTFATFCTILYFNIFLKRYNTEFGKERGCIIEKQCYY